MTNYEQNIKFSPGILKGKRERKPNCPKCGLPKFKEYSYCKEHYNEYMREYRKNPDVRVKETEYKREYRKRKKEPITAKIGVNLY
jgi:uncharacterized Zn finger protein (UPF0148 family)